MGDGSWLPSIRVDTSDPYLMGFQIGQRFAPLIKRRISNDPLLHSKLLPFAASHEGSHIIDALSVSNKRRYPRYWKELQGMADGSNVPLLEIWADMGDGSWLPSIRVDTSDPYLMGFQIGQRFAPLIKRRISNDPLLHSKLLPFAASHEGSHIIDALSVSNKRRYPRYWKELQGMADGSNVPLLEVLLLNFRKEVVPFMQNNISSQVSAAEECSDVLICDSIAVVAHNEDSNVSVKNNVFLVHASLPKGASFTAYTYAGELPSCAFGFNSHGVGFTLNAVPLSPFEIVAGGIGRNFISRHLLEANSLDSAIQLVQVEDLSVGHSYNIFDMNRRRIVNVETASRGRFSILEIGTEPFFHANMYKHLKVPQENDASSYYREERASKLTANTKREILKLLGDHESKDYPIYMQGPNLYTLCTILVDLDAKVVTLYGGNPTITNIQSQTLTLI